MRREAALDELYETERRVRVICDAGVGREQLQLPGVRQVTPEAHGYLLTVSGDRARGESGALRDELARIPGVRVADVFGLDLEAIFLSYVDNS